MIHDDISYEIAVNDDDDDVCVCVHVCVACLYWFYIQKRAFQIGGLFVLCGLSVLIL